MRKSLKQYRTKYLDDVLDLLWRQWQVLGVPGNVAGKPHALIDPEALILCTSMFGRYEPRLFDEMLDWLVTNGRFINIERLKTISRKEMLKGKDILPAIAGIMKDKSRSAKWITLARKTKTNASEPLFYRKSGEPMESFGVAEPCFAEYGYARGKMEFRGHFRPFSAIGLPGIVLHLRALLGVSARCEILAYLATNDGGHPSLIARETYYNQKTVHETLREMSAAELVRSRMAGRKRIYRLDRHRFDGLMGKVSSGIKWITWAPYFSAIEKIWLKLNDDSVAGQNPTVLASELRDLMREIGPFVERCGLGAALPSDAAELEDGYIDVFFDSLNSIITAAV